MYRGLTARVITLSHSVIQRIQECPSNLSQLGGRFRGFDPLCSSDGNTAAWPDRKETHLLVNVLAESPQRCRCASARHSLLHTMSSDNLVQTHTPTRLHSCCRSSSRFVTATKTAITFRADTLRDQAKSSCFVKTHVAISSVSWWASPYTTPPHAKDVRHRQHTFIVLAPRCRLQAHKLGLSRR